MKRGVIVYVIDGESVDEKFNVEDAVKKLNINADRVEVVFLRLSTFDIMDAWWSLTAKGMDLIVCMFAEVVNHAKLRLTGRELRLCG